MCIKPDAMFLCGFERWTIDDGGWMMDSLRRILVPLLSTFAFLLFSVLHLPAQSPTAKADLYFIGKDWAQAAKGYVAYLGDHEDIVALEKLTQCWENLGELEKAEKARTELVFAPGSGPDAKIRLARLLQKQGKFDAAKVWYEKYAEEGPDSIEAWRLAAHCAAAIEFKKDSLGYQVVPVAVLNTRGSDQLPVLNAGDLVYVSDRKGGTPGIWLASRSTDGNVGKPVSAPRKTLDKGFKRGVHYTVPGLRLSELAYVAKPDSGDPSSIDLQPPTSLADYQAIPSIPRTMTIKPFHPSPAPSPIPLTAVP
jgi:tetratricopeptide (TPR) repeat protein